MRRGWLRLVSAVLLSTTSILTVSSGAWSASIYLRLRGIDQSLLGYALAIIALATISSSLMTAGSILTIMHRHLWAGRFGLLGAVIGAAFFYLAGWGPAPAVDEARILSLPTLGLALAASAVSLFRHP